MWGEIITWFENLREPKKRKYKVTIYKAEILEEFEVDAVSRNKALDIADRRDYEIENIFMDAELI